MKRAFVCLTFAAACASIGCDIAVTGSLFLVAGIADLRRIPK